MENPIQSLDDDITCTLEKIHTLLEYSTRPSADEVLFLIKRAKEIWGEDTTNESAEDSVYEV